MTDEMKTEDTWILKHGIYKCGSCGKTQAYVDIADMNHCFNCDHDMFWYETKDGHIMPIKYRHHREDDVYTPLCYML